MSITTYAELKTAVADWLMRDDLTSRVPDFIALAEAHFRRKLRVNDTVKRSRAIATGRYLVLPKDWRESVNIERVADGKALTQVSMSELDKYRKQITDGIITANDGPERYAILDGEIELVPAPTPTDTYEIEMVYHAGIPALTDADPTNWLLKRDPDLYLYGALVHSAPFLKEDDRLATWGAFVKGIIDEMNAEYEKARYSGAPMTRPNQGNW